MKTPEVSKWNEICRTECINNSLNPDFVTKVIIIYLFKNHNNKYFVHKYFQVHVLYRFEVQQLIKFEVYDVDSSLNDLRHQDFLGSCETTLGHVIYWFHQSYYSFYFCIFFRLYLQ